MTAKKTTTAKKSASSEICENFRIIVTDDIMLAKTIIAGKFEQTHGSINLIEDAIASRQIFIGKSFLTGNAKKCYVCKNIESLIKAETIWDDLASGKYLNGHSLVYICDKLDSRTKFAKRFKSAIFAVKSDSLDIASVFSDSNNLSKDRRDLLFKRCDNSVTKFMSEFQKLAIYHQTKLLDTNDKTVELTLDNSFDEMLEANAFVNMVNEDMFKLSEYIMTQQHDKVYKYINDLSKTDFDFGLLSVLYNNFRNLYIYGCANKLGYLGTTNLTPFVQNNMKRYLPYYNSKRILEILSFLQKIDYGIKSGGIDSEYAFDYMLSGVLS